MKKLNVLILLLLLVISLVSCTKEVKTINDFSRFADITRQTDRIEVTFDNYSGSPFYFTIDNREDIDEIMDIIFSSSFNKMGQEMNDGDHTSIKIIQGEKVYTMHISGNKEGQYYYAFSNTDLQLKIKELAEEAGAFKIYE